MILLLLGNLSDDTLQKTTGERAHCVRVNCYDTVIPQEVDEHIKHKIRHREFDLLLFTSPSTFRNFIQIIGQENLNVPLKAVSIGPTTEKAMYQMGYPPLFSAASPDPKTIVSDIQKFFKSV